MFRPDDSMSEQMTGTYDRDIPASPVVVIVSADIEWSAVKSLNTELTPTRYLFGEWLMWDAGPEEGSVPIFHGGWGKISAAASAQHIIDSCRPDLVINLGTCGGFRGAVERDTIILADRVTVYDIEESMGDPVDHIAHYTTVLDLEWLGSTYPFPLLKTSLVSGDRDLRPEDITRLRHTYDAVAADWESGAIAWVARRNHVRCLILRGVSDLVGVEGGEAYDGNIALYARRARRIMTRLMGSLPAWIRLHYHGGDPYIHR